MKNLCRVCLGGEAEIPIFENEENVISKLSLCVGEEKVEDIEGYPRNICNMCNSTLDTICLFIKKYKESSKILKSSLLQIKCEDQSDNRCSRLAIIEIDLNTIKTEKDLVCGATDATTIPELWKLEQLKNLSIKKVCSNDTVIKNETSTVNEFVLEDGLNPKGKSIKTEVKEATPRKTIKTEVKVSKTAVIIREQKTKLLAKQKEPRKRKRRRVPPKLEPEAADEPKPRKPYDTKLCDTCGDVFFTAEQLSNHKKRKHEDISAQCTICGRTCASEYYLNRHIKRKHNDVKNFTCTVCGKSFAFKGELGTHVKVVHLKNTPKTFSCKICGKTYKCRKSVVVHERVVHTGERPAVCTICNTSFTHQDYLREHMRLHTGETPFKCPICGRGYAQRCNMKSHLRIHKISELDDAALSTIRPNYLRRLKA